MAIYPCQYAPGRIVWLVDTPGFDDTNRTDTEVLREIALWLTMTYKRAIRLRGIIYLHRITEEKMQGSAKRNLFMFKQLCGRDAFRQVILATTKWEKVTESEGIAREKQLSKTEDYWGYMRKNGSQITRHYNNRKSAMTILLHLISPASKAPRTSNVTLDIQSQMVDQGKPLHETSAGMELQVELIKERKRYEKKMAQLEKDLRNEHDADMRKLIGEERRRTQQDIEKRDLDNRLLHASVEGLAQQLQDAAQKIQQMETSSQSEKERYDHIAQELKAVRKDGQARDEAYRKELRSVKESEKRAQARRKFQEQLHQAEMEKARKQERAQAKSEYDKKLEKAEASKEKHEAENFARYQGLQKHFQARDEQREQQFQARDEQREEQFQTLSRVMTQSMEDLRLEVKAQRVPTSANSVNDDLRTKHGGYTCCPKCHHEADTEPPYCVSFLLASPLLHNLPAS